MSEKNLTLEEKETINKNTKKASKDLFLEYMPYLIIIFFVVIVVVGGVESVDNSSSLCKHSKNNCFKSVENSFKLSFI